MDRLTVNKRTADMDMVELAHNSCYAKDRRAMYKDYDGEYDARELASELLKAHAGKYCPADDEEFDWIMSEYLGEDLFKMTGLIALFYRNLWAMAELHDRLKHYEDLKESGRLVVLPEGKAKALLIKVLSESDIICPSDLGLPSQLHCNHHTCEKCWEAALKGGGENE